MSADHPAVSDSPVPAGPSAITSRSQPVFLHAMAPKTRRFMRLLARDVQRGDGRFPGPLFGHCASLVVLPCTLPWSFCDVSGAPPPAMSIVRRQQWGPSIGGRPAIAPPPLAHLPAIQRSNSDHAGKRYVLGRNRVSIKTQDCHSRHRNAISRELTSLITTTTTTTV